MPFISDSDGADPFEAAIFNHHHLDSRGIRIDSMTSQRGEGERRFRV